jgi:acyl-CoA synthetase (AMP-forming)/AMP-acid ligase II
VVADDSWLKRDEPSPSGFPDDPTSPAVLLFTSGTTAEPKAATLAHDQLLAYIFNTVEFGAADPDEAVLVAVPPFHIAGVAAILSSAYAGRRVVALPRFSPEGWLELAAREAVTHAFVVPTMLARIVAAAERDAEHSLPVLRTLAYGGARMPVPVLERAVRRYPEVDFVNAYGLTETSSTVCVLGPDDHRRAIESTEPSVRARLSSVGRPVDGVELEVVTGDGSRASVERPGEVLVRGPQVSGVYMDQPSQLDGDGWLHTGDLGWVDDAGYVFVSGRADDVIIRGGENISPSEIEDTLIRHPAVAAAAAVGLPDEEWGERVGAMLVLRAGVGTNGEELFRWARERLGSLKAPEVIMFRGELPTTPTGKVLRRQIRAELSAEARRRGPLTDP